MLIRDLESRTGLERATIRYYEREGLIAPTRHENGYREYTQEDCDNLLKIKLLRQLGMSLDKIRDLQQGREDFTAALTDQIRILEGEIRSKTRAREICGEMLDAGVCFDGLDAAYYLAELARPSPSVPAWSPKDVPEFREHLRRERHPVRRFLARSLDRLLLVFLLEFVLYVVWRLRPQYRFLGTVLSYGCWFLAVPVNALCLHLTGTTPGKWAFGLRVETCDGVRLSWRDALEREWDVLHYGMGFGIPIWSLWRLYQSWKDDRDSGGCDWDGRCEYLYAPWSWFRKIIAVGLAGLAVLLCAVTVNDLMKPRYRGDSLTVAQFAENYNDFLYLLDQNGAGADKLDRDGNWKESDYDNSFTIYIDGQPEMEYAPFLYETTGEGILRTVTYENAWTDIFCLDPLNGKPFYAAASILLAQDGIGAAEFQDFCQQYTEELKRADGHLIYGNIEVNWRIETENCMPVNDSSYIRADENEESRLSLWFEVTVHPA